MTNKSPIFPIPEPPHHFSDYGFDPQFDYFQVLEEARKHKRETSRPIDSLHFKLQKPISKDDSKKFKKTRKPRWWKNAALYFFKWKRAPVDHHQVQHHQDSGAVNGAACHHQYPIYRAHQVRAISGPVYITDSRSGSTTPYRTTSGPSSGPLAGTLTPSRKAEVEIPYISLREFNMDQPHRISASATPIYLVT